MSRLPLLASPFATATTTPRVLVRSALARRLSLAAPAAAARRPTPLGHLARAPLLPALKRTMASEASQSGAGESDSPPPLPHEAFPGAVGPAALEHLRTFSTCEVSDALLALGVASGGYIPDLDIYSPRPSNSSAGPTDGFRVVGPVFTIQMVLASDTAAPRPTQHHIDAAPPGSVLLIQAPPSARSACWGGLMSTAAVAQELAAVVVLGRVRDLAEHRALGFPVFARGHATLGQQPFTRPSALGGPLTIDAPHLEGGSFVVKEDDVILADEDGVLAVPAALVERVLEGAAERRRIDGLCAADLREGRGVKETFAHRRGG